LNIPNSFYIALKIAFYIWLLINFIFSLRIVKYSGSTFKQKIGQLLLIWLVPLLGVLLVQSLLFIPKITKPSEFSNDHTGDIIGIGQETSGGLDSNG
jgi:hypothetical protein